MSDAIGDPVRFRRIDALFDAVLDLPEAERSAWLDRECAGDVALRTDVEALLRSAATAESALGENVAEFAAPLFPGLIDEGVAFAPGERLGAWRVVREIGRGGMGAVYLAERADGAFERTAAIKVVKRGMDTAEVLRRFREERRILATLDHRNVARLLDGGATPDGRPFIVMEHVEGERIDRWCDRSQLDVRSRIELLRGVCDAVHQAHNRLVVHRDIKPSNVLVTEDGTPKLLDFGIAKLLHGPAGHLTSTGVRVLTPEYAAPEQTADQPVTTATDVYALGRLLRDLIQSVRHDAELDTIVARAMADDPSRRYASALQLGEDLGRWLDGMPIMARPDSFGYRAAKFVLRNRTAVAGGSAFLILLVAFAVSRTTAQRRTASALERAERERDTAEEVAGLLEDLFNASDPTAPRPERLDTFRVGTLLDRGAARVRAQLNHEPEVQARLLRAIGDAYRGLGLNDSAESVLTAAVELHRPSADTLALAKSLNSLGILYLGTGRNEAAEPYLRESLALRRMRLPPGDGDVIQSLSNLAAARQNRQDFDEAAALYDEAVAAMDASAVVDTPQLTSVLNGRAVLAQRTGDFGTADRLMTRILELDRARLGPTHARVALDLNNVAFVRMRNGRLDEADSVYAEAVDVLRATVGENHPWYMGALASMANVRSLRGRHAEARPLFEESLRRKRASPQQDSFGLAITLSQYADMLIADGDTAAALRASGEAVEIRRGLFGPDHPDYAVPLVQLARFRCLSGGGDQALADFEQAVRVLEARFPPDNPRMLDAREAHAGCLAHIGRLDEAESILVAAWETASGGVTSSPPPASLRFAERLAELAERRGDAGEADRWRALAGSR